MVLWLARMIERRGDLYGEVCGEEGEAARMRAGTVIDGRFELEVPLGKGGMGEVWRARQNPLGREVALKLLRPEFSALRHLRRRFAREARAAARLSHENIASVYDFGADESGRMFIAMEYVRGAQLTEATALGLSAEALIEVAMGLLSGLAHAHARGVVHRDLKPENVLLAGALLPTRHGTPKIVDFGIATLANDRHGSRDTGADQVVGTPMYMSPEQASGERDLSPRTDIYSLGLILYELAAGFHPFADDERDAVKVMARHVEEPIPPLAPREGLKLPEGFTEVVSRALAKSPRDRWRSAGQMRDALEPLWLIARQDPEMGRPPALLEQDTEADEDHVTVTARPHPTRGGREQEQSPALSPGLRDVRRVPFVGREREREELREAAERVVESGQGRVVLLEGEPGVGKTRLAMWLKEHLEERGIMRGHIGVFTRGTGAGMRGAQEVVESLLRTRGLSGSELQGKITRRFQEWGEPMSAHEVEALARFVRPSEREEDDGAELAGALRARLYEAAWHLLEAASGVHPRLLVLDDVQWAGAEFAGFLDYVCAQLRHRRAPVLVVATARADELGGNARLARGMQRLSRYVGETFERRALEGLTEDRARALIEALAPADDELAGALMERAAGNPLHLIVLLRYMVDEGLLEQEGSRFKAGSIAQVREAVPPSIADLFRVRIEQIDARYGAGGRLERLLTRAAILGRRFSFDVLESMLEEEGVGEQLAHLDEDFDALLEAGLITEVVGRGDQWYTFHYDLLRDTLIRAVLGPAQRRRLHKCAARALERAHEGSAHHLAAAIAGHWRMARDVERAVEWYWRAAQAARRSFLAWEALRGYDAAVVLMEQQLGLDGEADEALLVLNEGRFEAARVSRSRYLRALVYMGDLREGLSEFDPAERVYRRVVKMCGKASEGMPIDVLVPLCQAWLGLGHVAWQRGDFTAASWAFELVHGVLATGRRAPDIANSALRGLARVAWHRGEYARAGELAARARLDAIAMQDDEAHAESLWIEGEIARIKAQRDEAARLYEESFALYERALDPTGLARVTLSKAQLARHSKDFLRARALYAAALERYDRLGDRRGAGLCHNGLGEIARFEGRHEDAVVEYLRALEIMEAIGARYDVALTYSNLGLTEMRRGREEQAEHYLVAALSLVEAPDFPYLVAGVEYNLALARALQGDREGAEDTLRRVLDLNARVPVADLDFAEPLETLGRMRAHEGSLEEARELTQRARDLYEELGLGEDRARAESFLDALEVAMRSPTMRTQIDD
jgi:serine/threonine protein kinase/tetratricopeptide (TPR) repeat protein/DNA polymerase III delta prime subunit